MSWSNSFAAPNERRHSLFDLLGRERFADIAFGSDGKRFDNASFTALGGDHDDGHALAGVELGEIAEKLETVHHRHIDIAEDDIERTFCDFDESFSAIAGFEDLT